MSADDRTRIPINVEDIRVGDLIRAEWGGEEAREWRSDIDGFSFYPGAPKHFRLDRPKPAVVLPTEPTLGWATGETEGGAAVSNIVGYWSTGKGRTLLNRTVYTYPAPSGDAHLRVDRTTAFTPATAVPTEALDALRAESVNSGNDPDPVARARTRLYAIGRFLTAVGEATS